MKRLAIVCVAIAAVAAGTSSAAGAPSAQLTNFSCQPARDPYARAIDVTAVMRTVPGTRKMELKFDLLRKHGRLGHWFKVHGHDLGVWLSPSDPTLGQIPGDTWQLDKPVVNLPAPALYRFRVHFRWIGSSGRVVLRAVRVSPVCLQPELRPDLLVRSLSVHPPSYAGGSYSYVALIRNRGATRAGPFDVQLSLGPQTLTVQRLGPHRKRLVTFSGPACASGSYLTVTVDPSQQVDDYDRSNDSLTIVCP